MSLRRAPAPLPLAVVAAAATLPAAVLIAVGHTEVYVGSVTHLVGVGMTAAVATVAALMLTAVGARRNDGRTVLLGTAFGSGYPHGLRAPGLEQETRILAVCDVYDALRSTRVYRDAWPHERARALLREGSGTEFDERCFTALERVLEQSRADLPLAV